MNWRLHEKENLPRATPRSQILETPDQRLQTSAAKRQKQWFLWNMSAVFGTSEVRCLEKLHCKNEKRRDEDERQDWMQFAKRKRGTWM